jgi:hypothetical protein
MEPSKKNPRRGARAHRDSSTATDASLIHAKTLARQVRRDVDRDRFWTLLDWGDQEPLLELISRQWWAQPHHVEWLQWLWRMGDDNRLLTDSDIFVLSEFSLHALGFPWRPGRRPLAF